MPKDKTKPKPKKTVLFRPNDIVVQQVKADPGEWYLVGGGSRDRIRVLSQTAYRIRRGLITAFASPQGGVFEAQVSTDRSAENRTYPAELYLRWVPVKGK